MPQSLAGFAECSWSGQSGREKRDEQISSLLVRDIGVVTTASQLVYSKRAKIYTYDPPGDSLGAADRKYSGVKLLCVHDKRRYTKKSDTPPCSVRVSHGIVRTPELQSGTPPHAVKSLTSDNSPSRALLNVSPRGSRPQMDSATASLIAATEEAVSMSLESELGQMLAALASPRADSARSHVTGTGEEGGVNVSDGLEQKRRRTDAASPLASMTATQLLTAEQAMDQPLSLSL